MSMAAMEVFPTPPFPASAMVTVLGDEYITLDFILSVGPVKAMGTSAMGTSAMGTSAMGTSWVQFVGDVSGGLAQRWNVLVNRDTQTVGLLNGQVGGEHA